MSRQFPFTFKGKEYKIDEVLAHQLMSIAYNLRDDWDFVILITGDRMVRVGKSVLAMTICAFLAYCLDQLKVNKKPMNQDAYNLNNIFFENKKLVKEAQERPKYSVIHYDEAREGLAANKAMKSFQQDLIDFFTECGQLNHVFVIVCPDFFELKEDMAVARSELLINVFRDEECVERDIFHNGTKIPIVKFTRGNFEIYNRTQKDYLYQVAKNTRRKTYAHVKKGIHHGSFSNQYCLDEEEYKKLKKESLARFNKRHEEEKQDKKKKARRDAKIWLLDQKGKTTKEIQEILEKENKELITIQHINRVKRQNPLEKEGMNEQGNNNINIPPKREPILI